MCCFALGFSNSQVYDSLMTWCLNGCIGSTKRLISVRVSPQGTLIFRALECEQGDYNSLPSLGGGCQFCRKAANNLDLLKSLCRWVYKIDLAHQAFLVSCVSHETADFDAKVARIQDRDYFKLEWVSSVGNIE
jgi:hypothetical protein